MPYFSVIIPLYNKADYIKSTLLSVLNQDFTDFEVLIINDGSTDNSLEVLEQFSDNRIKLFNQENKGASNARNHGIKFAKGAFIALIDADDIWYRNHLSELRNQTSKFPDAELYCNNYEVFLNENTVKPAQFNFEFEEDIVLVKDFFKSSIINCVAWTSAVAFTKEKFEILGCFDETLDTNEDLDLWIKFGLNYSVSFNPKVTMSYKSYILDSLTKNETNQIRLQFLNRFTAEENENKSLKLFLDVNRYALAIRCKILNENFIYNSAKQNIDYKNLNYKQKALLKSPRSLLVFLKRFQAWLIKRNIYLTAFK
ncbi:glycosyltransferase family A protein [Winogradskyella sp. SYSU M77433]|uniref:glycosyltransferase family 2 protein n=1 Tax=Winogradskyella sp. SYSU M77433 TaxID=3042722 RepID=UPI00248037F9|nr:glycosyltransferase family A protein [Winogradskyella sp. SYSU M77433]MDH7913174.1 glycosyltransferase family A protein [Winogradskyella sp. SYSU M77433]